MQTPWSREMGRIKVFMKKRRRRIVAEVVAPIQSDV